MSQQQWNHQVKCNKLTQTCRVEYFKSGRIQAVQKTIKMKCHARKAQAFSHLIPHLHPCRFSSPVLSWTIAMFSLGVGPWTGEATRQEVETWVLCRKSIVSVFMWMLFLCCVVLFQCLPFFFHLAFKLPSLLFSPSLIKTAVFTWVLWSTQQSPDMVCVLRGILILKAECLLF